MVSEGSFRERAQNLENQFFAEVDQKLLDSLRSELDQSEQADELSKAGGILNHAIAKSLVAAGVSPRTIQALRLFPVVAVAWADGTLQASERVTVLEVADKHRIAKESPEGRLLESWLSKRPSPELFDAWEAYAKELVQKLTPEEAAEVRTNILAESTEVAQAAGGLLGWNAISRNETATMKRIESALTRG